MVGTMIAGITEHPADFPHCDTAVLEAARLDFLNAGNSLVAANAEVARAARVKKEAFGKLQTAMKQQIKLAQVDCSDSPVKLGLIGWGPRREAEAIDPPGQPLDLRLCNTSNDTLALRWRKPTRDPHRPIHCYQVYRREVKPSSNGDGWHPAGTAMENEITLKHEPTDSPLRRVEYRVTALNRSGESVPSNTITVVL